MVKFPTLTMLTSLLCLALAGVWFFRPEWILTHWRLVYDYDGGFMSRRTACLFLALSVILMTVRNTTSRVARRAVANGIITACLSLIALGLYEWLSGHVGRGIFFAIGLESALTVAFLGVDADRPATATESAEPVAPAR